MTEPHSFRPIKAGSNRCKICGGWSDHSCHSLELFTDADKERQMALETAECERMTLTLRQPLADVSGASGRLERESPLFGGGNLTLF